MLKVWVGNIVNDMEEYIAVPGAYFNHKHKPEWILSDFSKTVIRDIDKSEVIDVDCVKSPILGMIPINKIAGGTKTLIMMKYDDEHIFNASSCGDNCAKYIIEIAKEKDLVISLGHIMDFPDDMEVDGIIMNKGKEFHNKNEFVMGYLGAEYGWQA
jgi:hypothetical protein